MAEKSCGGHCGSCGGCARELVLTEAELQVLDRLAQIPFLPVGRKTDSPVPIDPDSPEDGALSGLVLQCLEKKGLIRLDFDQPLAGAHDPVYEAYPVRGSMALTQRGQEVLEWMHIQGISQ